MAAVLLRTYVPGQVIRYPLSEHLTTQLVGHGVSYFSPSKFRPVTGVTMLVTSTVTGDAKAGTSTTAVWNSSTHLYDETNHATFVDSTRRVAFDRRTAQLVMCCGASVNGNTAVRQSGLVGFLWPLGTQRHAYQVFDSAMDRAHLASYEGTTSIDGITVYRFVEQVPTTQIGKETVPPALAGLKGSSLVSLPVTYTATNTFWVDPVTGAQLNEIENEHLVLTDDSGRPRALLLNASLTDTPQSLQKVVQLDRNGRNELELVTVIAPVAAGLLGLAALAGGVRLARRRRDNEPGHEDVRAAGPVTDPAV